VGLVSFITAVDTKLKALGGRVFYGDQINPNTPIPYISWKYTASNPLETIEDFFIEVSFTDSGTDATRIETAVDAVDGDGDQTNPTGLNYYDYGGGSSPSFRMYRMNRGSVPAVNENLLRRELRYQVRVYNL